MPSAKEVTHLDDFRWSTGSEVAGVWLRPVEDLAATEVLPENALDLAELFGTINRSTLTGFSSRTLAGSGWGALERIVLTFMGWPDRPRNSPRLKCSATTENRSPRALNNWNSCQKFAHYYSRDTWNKSHSKTPCVSFGTFRSNFSMYMETNLVDDTRAHMSIHRKTRTKP